MVNRPSDFDITTPTGASSPRSGDDELRKIKEYTQNAYNDLHQASGAAVTHRELYGTDINASGQFNGDLTGDVTGNVVGNVTGNVTGDLTGDVTGDVTGDLTGNVTGNVTGNLTGDVTGDLTGDVTGDVTGDLTGNVTGNVTGDVTGDLTGDVTGNVTGDVLNADNTVLVDSSAKSATFSGGVTADVTGDLTGNADTATTFETARSITIAGDVTASATNFDGSADITLTTSMANNAVDLGTHTTGNYVQTITGTANEITVSGSGSESADVTLSLPATINADTTGNADTATALETARTIGGVSFDGTANINLPGVNTAGNQNTSGNAATATAADTVETVTRNTDATHYLTFVTDDNTTAAAENLYTDADIGVNPADGEIIADLKGNADTASALETARTFTFQKAAGASAGITGSVSFDGSGNVTVDTTLQGSVTEGSVESAGKWTTARNFVFGGDMNSLTVAVDGSENETFNLTLANGVVDTAALASNAVTNAKMADNAVGSSEIASNAVTTAKISNDAVTYAKMQNLGTANRLLGGTATGNISEVQVATAMISDDAVTNAKIANSAVGTNQIASDAVTAAKIAANAVDATALNVSGNGSSGQILQSDGDGSFSWTTNSTGDITAVVAGTGLSGGATSGSATLNLDLSELTDMTADVVGSEDELILMDNKAERRKAINEIKLGQFNNDLGWTSNVGTVTGLTAGSLIDVGSGATPSVSVDLSEATEVSSNFTLASTADHVMILDGGVAKKVRAGNLNLGSFRNDQGWTSTSGTVTSVSVGTGLDVSNASTTPSITLDLSEFTDMTADVVGANDELILLDSGAERRKAINEIKLGQFNNDLGWTANTGTITGVVAGSGLTGGATSGSATLTVGAGTGITVDSTTVGISSGGVTATQLASDAVTAAKIADNAVGAAALNVSGNGTSGQTLTSDGDGSFSWTDGGSKIFGQWSSSVAIPQTSGTNNPGQIHGANITIPAGATQALINVGGNRNKRGTGGITLRINGSTIYTLMSWTNNDENERGYGAGSWLLDLSTGTITRMAAATSQQTLSTAQGNAAGWQHVLKIGDAAITSFNLGITASGHSQASASIQSGSTVYFS